MFSKISQCFNGETHLKAQPWPWVEGQSTKQYVQTKSSPLGAAAGGGGNSPGLPSRSRAVVDQVIVPLKDELKIWSA